MFILKSDQWYASLQCLVNDIQRRLKGILIHPPWHGSTPPYYTPLNRQEMYQAKKKVNFPLKFMGKVKNIYEFQASIYIGGTFGTFVYLIM